MGKEEMPKNLDATHEPHFLGDGVFRAWPPHPKVQGTSYTRTDIAEAEITRLQQSAHKAIYLILEEGSAGEAAVVLIKAIANIGE